MNHTQKMKRLLERIAEIEEMERGKLCQMGDRPHYNHQTWENGKNVVRYVPAREREFLQNAIDGYQTFLRLAEEYADEVIRQTRRKREKMFKKPSETKTKNAVKRNEEKSES
jgi:hypothetical protein